MPSISTGLLLQLLGQWCFSERRHGGFELIEHKKAGKELLQSLMKMVTTAVKNKNHEVLLVFDTEWSCQWPRPDSRDSGKGYVYIMINKDGPTCTNGRLVQRQMRQNAHSSRRP